MDNRKHKPMSVIFTCTALDSIHQITTHTSATLGFMERIRSWSTDLYFLPGCAFSMIMQSFKMDVHAPPRRFSLILTWIHTKKPLHALAVRVEHHESVAGRRNVSYLPGLRAVRHGVAFWSGG